MILTHIRSLYVLPLLAAGLAWSQETNLFTDAEKAGEPAAARLARDPRSVRSRVAGVRLEALGQMTTLNLFPDTALAAQRLRTQTAPSGEGEIWVGEVATETGSEVMLSVRDGMVAGNVRRQNGEFYSIRPQGDGTHLIEQMDTHRVPIDDETLVPPADLLAGGKEDSRTAVLGQRDATASTLDVLVVFTSEARFGAGGDAAIRSRIDLAVAEANQSFVTSGIPIVLRLVHAAEAAPSAGQAADSNYLNTVTRDAGILALRDRYGADIVSAWISGPGSAGGTVGIGWVMTRPSVGFASAAYSVVETNFAPGPNYSFGHEIGHNLGSAHDRANSSSQGAYSYSYGYQQPNGATSERFVTIMAYRNGCSNCPRINQWSNPNVYYAGRPTGVPSTELNAADNALALGNTRIFAEQWRSTTAGSPGGGTNNNQAPAVSSILPSAGTGSDAVFTATYSDANGASDIGQAWVAVTVGTQLSSACVVIYNAATGAVGLRDDAGSSTVGTALPGSSAVLQNSQCRVNASGVQVTTSGNTLSLRVSLGFFGSFRGTKDLQLRAIDKGGLDSNWQRVGNWTIPDSSLNPPTAPSIISVNPPVSEGRGVTFTATIEDLNGAAEISSVNMIINNQLAATNACYLYIMPRSRTVLLLNDSGSSWLLGSATLSNSQCTVDAARITYDASGNRLVIAVPVQFQTRFAGAKGVYIGASDATGRFSSWIRAATFTVY